MSTKAKALLAGGPQAGQTIELDEETPEITILSRVLERNGQWRVIHTARYKLAAKGPPLRYEFED